MRSGWVTAKALPLFLRVDCTTAAPRGQVGPAAPWRLNRGPQLIAVLALDASVIAAGLLLWSRL